MKKFEIILSILMIFLVPLAGTLIMYIVTYMVPMDTSEIYLVYAVILLSLLLIIPYIMMKFLFHSQHMQNKKEEEFNLIDIPKEQEINVIKEEIDINENKVEIKKEEVNTRNGM
ncbi:MAG: hypothetical protein K0R98_1007 [Rickettsiaceae bacterium]|jgi:hypothetical protein|nr:hypothetical protein [Rickettsiaceae bacterium]